MIPTAGSSARGCNRELRFSASKFEGVFTCRDRCRHSCKQAFDRRRKRKGSPREQPKVRAGGQRKLCAFKPGQRLTLPEFAGPGRVKVEVLEQVRLAARERGMWQHSDDFRPTVVKKVQVRRLYRHQFLRLLSKYCFNHFSRLTRAAK